MEPASEFAFRLGGEYDVVPAFTVRAGYAFGSNPVPEVTIFPIFPAIVENHLMLGASYQVIEPLTIHGAYELALNNQQTAAAHSIVAHEFNNSTSELQENILHFSVTWMLK